jgi:4-hydroxy-tetrahydrodipicolinate synthase
MRCSGLWPPVATPFGADLQIDLQVFLAHCRTLLAEGASGLAVLGTTSEANSLSLAERVTVLDSMVNDGIPAEQILPGTGACALGDAVALSAKATKMGCAGVLLLPPFFYKGVSDQGLFDYVACVIRGVADDNLRIYLYHIPQMASTGWSLELVARLAKAFPETIVGLKDSTGNWDGTRAFIEAFPDLSIFPANESHLQMAIPLGAAGCISATANVNAAGIVALLEGLAQGKDTSVEHEQVRAVRAAVSAHPLVPAVKAVLAEKYKNPTWVQMRPPLVSLSDEATETLKASAALKNGVLS